MTDYDLLVAHFSSLLVLGDVVGYFVQPGANNVGVTGFCERCQVGRAEHGCIGHNGYFSQPMLCLKSLDDGQNGLGFSFIALEAV